jgi:hypothetical protein
MLSGRLVHLIELHWEEIIARSIAQIHREPQMAHMRAIVETELRERAQILLENLGHWLRHGNEAELTSTYQELGRLRCEEGVPLHEAVHALCILREKMIDFAQEPVASIGGMESLELYEQEELERRLGRFFDLLIIHMVHGYERELRKVALIGH